MSDTRQAWVLQGPREQKLPCHPPVQTCRTRGQGQQDTEPNTELGEQSLQRMEGASWQELRSFLKGLKLPLGSCRGTVRDPGAEHLHPPLQFPISSRCPHCPELTTGPGAKKPDAAVQPAQPLDTRCRDGDRLGASARCPAQKVTNSEIQMQPMSKLSAGEGMASNLTKAAKIKEQCKCIKKQCKCIYT